MLRPVAAGVWRWHAAYLGVLAGAVGAVAAVGVFGRGGGSTAQVVSARGEPFEMVTGGVYANNPERLVAEGIGWDAVTLLLVVPALLLVARGVARGSLRARLAATGLLGYVFYQYLMYAMAWAVGPLLPAFIVLYAASLLGIAWFVASVPLDALAAHAGGRFPRRAVGVYAGAIALLLVAMWAPMVGEVIGGRLEGTLLGQTTLVVQALDLGIVVPLALTTVILTWRRMPAGHLLTAVVVVKGLAMATAICAMLVSAWYVEGELDVAGLAVFAAISIASLALLAAVYRAIPPAPTVPAGGSVAPAEAT